MGVAEDTVSIDEGVGDLADHIPVGETYDEAVLGSLVLILVLGTHLPALTVVGLSLATTAEFDLEAGEVGLTLRDAYEGLQKDNGNGQR